jgi:hypothetical protein
MRTARRGRLVPSGLSYYRSLDWLTARRGERAVKCSLQPVVVAETGWVERKQEDATVPRSVRLRVIEEPPVGTRAVIDLQGEAYLAGQVSTGRSAGLLQQLCGECGRTIVRGRPHLTRDDAGNPVVLRCAHCRAFNEMNQD